MTGRVVVEADGGSRGNPGPAGYGAVVRDAESGEVLAERQEGLGVATNNVAEYRGLVAGLEAAADVGASRVDVRMDSKLVVEQMCGRWKIKNAALRPLALRAKEVADGFAVVRYEWIPRERNKHADRLANEAMDTQAGRDTGTGGSTEKPEAGRDTGDTAATRAAPTEPASGTRTWERTGASTAGAASSPDTPTVAGTPERPVAPSTSTASGGSAAQHRPQWTGATGTPTRLLLLRHGQTELSVDRRYSGRGDVPLTDLGLRQAEAAAKRIAALDGLDEAVPIVASPLTRATRTARAVADALGGEVVTHRELRETDFGEWEGLTFTEASQRYAELHGRWLGDTSVRPPRGESFDDVHQRVRTALDDVLDRYAGRTVIVVSHVTPIKSMLRTALDVGPSLLFRLHLDLASLSIAEFYPDDNTSVRLVNDTSHLS